MGNMAIFPSVANIVNYISDRLVNLLSWVPAKPSCYFFLLNFCKYSLIVFCVLNL
jgi:hypothetical protein